MALEKAFGHIKNGVNNSLDYVDGLFKHIDLEKEDHVKHVVAGKLVKSSPVVLDSTNHAFWIGKIPIAPDINTDLYTDELLVAICTYIKRHLGDYGKGCIYMSRTLSELCNGVDDVRGTKTEELVSSCIQKHAKTLRVPIQVVDLEKSPLHAYLFERMRESQYADGMGCDMEQVFSRNIRDGLPDGIVPGLGHMSHALAYHLYHAAHECEPLYYMLANLRPEEIKDNPESPESSKWYGMIEIAIRMSGLANGVTINGGADRQKRYDDIIQGLLSPKATSKKWEQVHAAIKPIRDVLCPYYPQFHSIYISAAKNPFLEKKRQKNSRTAVLVNSTITAVLLSVGALVGKEVSHNQQKQVIQKMVSDATKSKLKYTSLDVYGNVNLAPLGMQEKELTLSYFMVGLATHASSIFPGLKSVGEEDLALLMFQELSSDPTLVRDTYMSGIGEREFIFRFVEKYKTYFEKAGVDLTPYFAGHPDVVKWAFEKETTRLDDSDSPLVILNSSILFDLVTNVTVSVKKRYYDKNDKKMREEYFMPSMEDITDQDAIKLVAEVSMSRYQIIRHPRYGILGVSRSDKDPRFAYDMSQFLKRDIQVDFLLSEFSKLPKSYLSGMIHTGGNFHLFKDYKHIVTTPEWDSCISQAVEMRDPLHNITYEVCPDYSDDPRGRADILLARRKGETTFTATRTKELYDIYKPVYEKWGEENSF